MDIEYWDYEVGLALVTTKGLLYGDRYYTNSEMIKNQWFEKASYEPNWFTPVLFSRSSPEKIMICNFSDLDFAISVNSQNRLNKEEVELYHQRLQQIISELKRLRQNSESMPDK